MKRYLLFSWLENSPLGGGKDFQSDYDTIEEAVKGFDKNPLAAHTEGNIFDSVNKEIVLLLP